MNENELWVRFAVAISPSMGMMTDRNCTSIMPSSAASYADGMVEEYKKRFSSGGVRLAKQDE
jgi:hypothetical protein